MSVEHVNSEDFVLRADKGPVTWLTLNRPDAMNALSLGVIADFDRHITAIENDRAVRTASSEQVRMPIFTEGLEQWKNYEPWLGPLKDALGDVLPAYPGVPKFGTAT